MKKRNRLKKNEDFQKVFKRGTSMANRQFVLYTLDQPKQEELRVGLSVSKKNRQCRRAQSGEAVNQTGCSGGKRAAQAERFYYYRKKTRRRPQF